MAESEYNNTEASCALMARRTRPLERSVASISRCHDGPPDEDRLNTCDELGREPTEVAREWWTDEFGLKQMLGEAMTFGGIISSLVSSDADTRDFGIPKTAQKSGSLTKIGDAREHPSIT